MSTLPGRRLAATVVAVSLAVLASCSARGDTAPVARGPASDHVRVGLVEWGFTTSAPALLAGPVVLEVTNAGATPHDVQVLVDGEVVARSDVLDPGEEQRVTADLTGVRRAQLLCTLPGHESQGMVQEIDVVEPSTDEGTGRHSG